MAFESNFAAFDNAIKEGKERAAAAAGGFGPRLNYFSWKNGDVKILRFLAEPIAGDFAEWVITNDGKSADFLLDPEGTNWVQHFGGQARERGTSGALIEPKVRKLGMGVAVLRDETPIAGSGRTEIVDYLSSFTSKKDNQTYPSRYFGIVKLSMGNFWDQLVGIGRRNGTICDRDFEIRREGEMLATKYIVSPIDPIDELRDPEVVRAFYGYGRPYNEEDPDRYLYCPSTLPEWCGYYSGEERAKRLLAPKAGGGAQQASFINPALVQSYPVTAGAGYAVGTYVSGPAGAATPYAQQQPGPIASMPQQFAANGSAVQAAMQQPAAPISPPVQGGSWAGAEDEAQAVSSSASTFADLKSKLMPNLSK